ncbi:ROK family protein [Paludisphaera sp.]|uniref:ROK family protein n=1 Tax=Paludisphaera sp. TaxID=2017432 RepID=UPI00301D6660
MPSHHPWAVGVEIGGTKLQLGLSRHPEGFDGLIRRTIVPADGARGILAQIEDGFAALGEEHGLRPGDVRAVGVGFGGPVDAESGRTETSFQVEGWTGFPLAGWFREALGVPLVSVHNDADVAGLAESRLGAGRGRSPILYLTIGSGIGGALIIDGRIYRGAGRGAAEIGHLRVPPSDLAPAGAEWPELEKVASGWGIGAVARDLARTLDAEGRRWGVQDESGGDPASITAVDVADAARRDDPNALRVLGQAHDAMAHALCEAVALIAPARIILGGGVSLMGEDLWFAPIRSRVDAGAFAPFRGSFDIVAAELGEAVVVHGALELARDALKASR